MPSSHLILCRALLLLPSVFPSIRVFSNESVLHIRWPKYSAYDVLCVYVKLAGWQYTALMYSFPYLEPDCCSTSGSNCCFLTCIQISLYTLHTAYFLHFFFLGMVWKCKKAKCLSKEALQIAGERRDTKGKGEKERYTDLNAEFQRTARRDKKAFLSDQCKQIEENNTVGKTRDLFQKIGDTREHFMQRWVQ